jgi:hypothetical protein
LHVQQRVLDTVAAAAATTGQQRQSLQPPPLQLFSLCLSYAKHAASLRGVFSGWVCARFAADLACLAQQIYTTCYNNRHNTVYDRRLWLLLAARSLHAAGTALSDVAGAVEGTDYRAESIEFISVAEKLRPGHTVMSLLTDCADVAAWLSQQSAELPVGSSSSNSSANGIAAKAAAVQQSISQAVATCNSIHAQDATHSSSSGAQQDVDAVTLAALLQPAAVFADVHSKLQAFSAAVAAMLPTPYCCNNPGCSTLSEASELRLVWGKSSRCSKCKTSRSGLGMAGIVQ